MDNVKFYYRVDKPSGDVIIHPIREWWQDYSKLRSKAFCYRPDNRGFSRQMFHLLYFLQRENICIIPKEPVDHVSRPANFPPYDYSPAFLRPEEISE